MMYDKKIFADLRKEVVGASCKEVYKKQKSIIRLNLG